MMLGPFGFGPNSIKHYNTLDWRLQDLLDEAIQIVDFSILCGHRNKKNQNALVTSIPPRSKLWWPDSEHNNLPSTAVDIAPHPIDWTDHPLVRARFYFLMGIIYSKARAMNLDLIFGKDWDSDHIYTDQNFHDLPHIQIAE